MRITIKRAEPGHIRLAEGFPRSFNARQRVQYRVAGFPAYLIIDDRPGIIKHKCGGLDKIADYDIALNSEIRQLIAHLLCDRFV